jgi:hypothetical protein
MSIAVIIGWITAKFGIGAWTAFLLGAPAGIVTLYVAYEMLVGGVRRKAMARARVQHGDGPFVGLGLAAEPRVYDGLYHYDFGVVRFADGEALTCQGDRGAFVLDPRLVVRLWLGTGPRHWTPRKVVYVEYRPLVESPPRVFSLQPLEERFWPWTERSAQRLCHDLNRWRRAGLVSGQPPIPCLVPEETGAPANGVPIATAVKGLSQQAMYSMLAATLLSWVNGPEDLNLTPFLLVPALTAALALFLAWPHLEWGQPGAGATIRECRN